ncbi:MAG TPA: hypothetical protein VIY72_05515 [Acidimicrobiales bacterium]
MRHSTTDHEGLSPLLRTTIAAALAGAAIIHLAMVPSHVSEWAVEGVAFLVTGWVQLAVAVALLVRPRRWVLWVALATSVAAIAAWAVSRTTGPPFGPNSGVAHDASFIDVTCVVLEAVAVLASAVALWRPRLTAEWRPRTVVVASIIPVAALLLGSIAVASPSATEHAHGSHDGTAADDHDHGETAPDPLGLSLLSNGHHHAIEWHDLDPATQAELDRQLAITREVADVYPTVAAAEAAGYRRAGPYSPGLGAHYTKAGPAELNVEGVMTDEALRHPLSVLYDGNEPDSELVGFMYYSLSQVEPTGFVGTNDVWHTHSNVCVSFGPDGTDSPLGADLEVTEEQCEAAGGVLLPTTQWMVHVWTVPGYENPAGGVFAEVNPRLACSDGTYFRLPPEEWPTNLLNVCASKAPGEPRET